MAEQAPILPRLLDSCVSAAPAPAAQKQSATVGGGREGGGREGGDGRQHPTQGHHDARYSLRSEAAIILLESLAPPSSIALSAFEEKQNGVNLA